MKCPVCKDVTLLMSEKNGVEIDYCPECRGIWLDRGELDKIVERARAAEEGYRSEHTVSDRSRSDRVTYDDRRSSDDRRSYDEHAYRERKKKKQSPISALSDIMEIFGGE